MPDLKGIWESNGDIMISSTCISKLEEENALHMRQGGKREEV